MYCRNCGIEVNENAEYCIGWGVAPLNGDKHCDNCGVKQMKIKKFV